jgi:phosphoesterase RecJ-like protein
MTTANIEMSVFRKMADLIAESESILVTSHVDPDGDSIGSLLALAKYLDAKGKKSTLVIDGIVPGKYRSLPDVKRINSCDQGKGGFFDLAVLLECPNLQRVGGALKLIAKETKIINIDHHPDNIGFGDLVLIDAGASSVGEILAEFFTAAEFEVDKDAATLLYAAILTDTGRFRFGSTTRRTMEIAGRMIEYGADPREITDNIYYSLPEPMLRLMGKVFTYMELSAGGRICLIPLGRRILDSCRVNSADLEGIAEYILFGKDVIVGGLLKEIDNEVTKVSLRSRGKVNVSRLAHKYGGGGHFNASGYTINLPLEKARLDLQKDLEEIIGESV